MLTTLLRRRTSVMVTTSGVMMVVALVLLLSGRPAAGFALGAAAVALVVLARVELHHARVAHRLEAITEQQGELSALLHAAPSATDAVTSVHEHVLGLEAELARARTDLKRLRRLDDDLRARLVPRNPLISLHRDNLALYDQTQAAMNLFSMFTVTAPVPTMRGWAASPDVVMLLVEEMLTHRPRLVLECGSGVSTLWLALAITQRDLPTRVVSLDHEPHYAEKTRATLREHGVDHVAEVRDAPLVAQHTPRGLMPWYSAEAFADLRDVGLVFIDGPPEATGSLARFPAMPLLTPHLADDAVVVLDDSARDDETVAVGEWSRAEPTMSVEHHRTDKGTAVLRRGHLTRGEAPLGS